MARFFKPTKKPSFSNKHQELMIERMDHQGAGIAYQNKKPVFIEGAIKGEKVLAQLTESKSKFAKAQLIKVLQPSPDRVTPFCSYYEQCGGCNQQHLRVEAQLEYKQQALSQLMAKFAKQALNLSPSIVSQDRAYRRRARLSIKLNKKDRQLVIGFRRKRSSELVDITHCPVLLDSLNLRIAELRKLLLAFDNPAALGHLELVQADNTTVVVLRHTQPLTAKDKQALIDYAQSKQLSLYLMPEAGQLDHITGAQPYYSELGFELPFLPSHFIQVNQEINKRMVAQAIEWLDPQSEDRVLDLFSGLGNFTQPLASRCKQVVGVEGVQDMVDWAQDNAAHNQLSNVTYYQANLEQDWQDLAWSCEKFDKILLDPARDGASGIIDKVSLLGASAVLYVSCNPATLARDSQSLINQGYRLVKLGMLDMFPHTSHLESMALFEK